MPKLVAVVSVAVLIAGAAPVAAETPLERGAYLMQSIVACGNCHTPKGPEGDLADMELAGGFKIDEPVAYQRSLSPK